MTREAYSHEASSVGWWPGNGGFDAPMFYAYAAPEPPGFRESKVRPAQAFYEAKIGEFLLPYDAVRNSADPADGIFPEHLRSRRKPRELGSRRAGEIVATSHGVHRAHLNGQARRRRPTCAPWPLLNLERALYRGAHCYFPRCDSGKCRELRAPDSRRTRFDCDHLRGGRHSSLQTGHPYQLPDVEIRVAHRPELLTALSERSAGSPHRAAHRCGAREGAACW